MKSRHLILALLVCLLGWTVASAQDVQLLLSLDKATYLLGEPFEARIELKPLRNREVTIPDAFQFQRGLSLAYRHSSQTEFHVWSPGIVSDTIGEYPPLRVPAKGVALRRIMAYDSAKRSLRPLPPEPERQAGAPLDQPGTYEIQAVLRLGGTTIRSNSVSVQVQAPQGREADAARVWLAPDILQLIDEGYYPQLPSHVEALNRLKGLAGTYKDTSYGQLAAKAVAGATAPPAVGRLSSGEVVQSSAAPASGGATSSPDDDNDVPAWAKWTAASLGLAALIGGFLLYKFFKNRRKP